jgi:5'-3' exoribonuclease 2
VQQPRHFEEAGKEEWVWKLVKSLYGLKQAGRMWNREMHEALVGWGF